MTLVCESGCLRVEFRECRRGFLVALRGRARVPAPGLFEVEVDTLTGVVHASRVWTGMSVGRLWVPDLATTQVEGAVVQGISYALYEDRRVDPATGRLLTSGLETYRIAGVGDAPEITVHFDDVPFDTGSPTPQGGGQQQGTSDQQRGCAYRPARWGGFICGAIMNAITAAASQLAIAKISRDNPRK